MSNIGMLKARQQGFTLIELITILILLGILSVTVVPKFFSASSFAANTVQTQIISQLRLLQLQAMNQRGLCQRFVVTNDHFGLATCTGSVPVDRTVSKDDVAISIGNDTTLDIRFDNLGRPHATDGDCFSGATPGCTLTLRLEQTLSVIIEPEGYIHAE